MVEIVRIFSEEISWNIHKFDSDWHYRNELSTDFDHRDITFVLQVELKGKNSTILF